MSKPFEAKIYCGLGVGYSSKHHSYKKAEKICQEYVDDVKWCVSVTKTRFVYANGSENGIIVGIIFYPRFPLKDDVLKKRTTILANRLMKQLKQNRVSIVFNDSVIMRENETNS